MLHGGQPVLEVLYGHPRRARCLVEAESFDSSFNLLFVWWSVVDVKGVDHGGYVVAWWCGTFTGIESGEFRGHGM